MPKITFNDSSFDVNHAVKGADYVHGYDENGVLIVSFEGVSDFSTITYSGSYMNPADCAEERCNKVRCVSGKLYKLDGTPITVDPTDLAEAVPAEKGGTGKTTLKDAMNALINSLGAGTAAPKDDDYMISQYINGGEENTTYYRRKMSHLWQYIKSKADTVYAALAHEHSADDVTSGTLPLARGGTGQTTVPKALYALTNGASALTATGLATGDYVALADVSATTGKKTTIANLATFMNTNASMLKIASGTYTGTGTKTFTLTFSTAPKIVVIAGTYAYRVFVYGSDAHAVGDSTSYSSMAATWNSTTSVTLGCSHTGAGIDYSDYADRFENASGTKYTYYIIY